MQTFPTTQAFDLSEDQRNTLLNSLRVAAEKFDANVATLSRDEPIEADLRRVFTHQAKETRELASRIESAEYVKLGREVE